MAAPDLWLLDDARIMGGGQLFALRLARHARDRRCVIVCPRDSELARRCAEQGVPTRHARFPAPLPTPAFAAAAAALPRVLREAPGDAIVVGNSARTQAAAAAAWGWRRARAPRFVHLMHERDSARRPSARAVHRRFGRMAALGANAVQAYRDALGVPVAHLNNFLGPDQLAALVAVRDGRPSPRPLPVVGIAGRLIPEKGILEAVRDLGAVSGGWAELLIAGERQDEAYAREVEAAAAPLGERVRLLGHVADMPHFLRSLDLLLVPSTGNEAQPTVILEALAAGCPVAVRRAIWSSDFDGLPVAPFDEVAAALSAPPAGRADPAELARRFGPEQALAGIAAALGPG
jgi:glycosyltransferase involved in cell wall biosynthesis